MVPPFFVCFASFAVKLHPMPKRHRLLILLACGVLAAGLYAILYYHREPSFEGQSFSQWLRKADDSSFEEGSAPEALEAIRQMGVKAHPYLLAWIRYQEPPWKTKFRDTINAGLAVFRQGWMIRENETAIDNASAAMQALISLGQEARPAIPELVSLMNDPKATDSAWRAVAVLAKLGTKDTFPPVLAVLTNQHHQARLTVVGYIPAFGTNARPAIPALLQCLQDTNIDIARAATFALGALKLEPQLVVSPLTTQLSHSNARMRYATVHALARFEAEARPAIPALLGALTDPELKVRRETTNALRRIDPQTWPTPAPAPPSPRRGRRLAPRP